MSNEKNSELSEFLLYNSPNGEVRVEVFFQNETVWLTQKQMADLFDVTIPTINEHLKNIFTSQELEENSVVRNFRITASDGKAYDTKHYNLDGIISLGYRVNSVRGTQFRIWATQRLREYMVKGFTIDDERLKQGKTLFGQDYFKELLERIRSIRTSERRIYQQITDIFAECSIDYDRHSPTTKDFFAMVQNKFHFAIVGQTAPEIISTHADHQQPNMGLKTWKNSPKGRILKSDVKVAKNYLSEKEIKDLERAVSSFFDYIEAQVDRRKTFTMLEFAESVDKFLNFMEYKVLDDKGSVSRTQAEDKAIAEYDQFNKTQRIESDFDREIKKYLNQEKEDASG